MNMFTYSLEYILANAFELDIYTVICCFVISDAL